MRRSAARGGVLSLGGAVASSALGFVFTVVCARQLGVTGSGVVVQSIAAFTIALGVARFGMDTGAVWLLPRLADGAVSRIRGALLVSIGSAVLVGVVCAAVLALLAPVISSSDEVQDCVRAVAWFLPVAAGFTVAMSATRALGGVAGFVLISNVLVPLARPLLVLAVVSVGAGYQAVCLSWAVPFLGGLVLGLIIIAVQVRRHERLAAAPGALRPDRETTRTLLSFSLPRVFATSMEQGLTWIDVILVGAIAGSSAAGIYGTASRFMAAGLVIDSALRVVVAPLFSRLLKAGRTSDLQGLYSETTVWLVLLSTPIYLLLGIYAPTILNWLGAGFASGATAMRILCAGAALTLATGNIHSLLLMSGRSGWAAFNKAVILTFNVVGNLVLIPWIGIEGAAIAWAVSMLADALMAAIEVHTLVGVRLEPRPVGSALLVPAVSVGIPALAVHWWLGDSMTSLLLATVLGLGAMAVWVTVRHRQLGVTELFAIVRPGIR